MTVSTEALYDGASQSWTRTQPVLLSDYTARPFLLDWCEPVSGLSVLDLGCGEGYFARNLQQRGAGSILGIDLSQEMIERAREEESRGAAGIRYRTGNATDLGALDPNSFDLVVAVFLFNYLDREAMGSAMKQIARILRPGGRFVFAVPHPSLPFIRDEKPPFFFSPGSAGYFSGQDQLFEGEIHRRDGVGVPVRCVHKSLADYFGALRQAGFDSMPELEELGVTPEMIDLDPAFFAPLSDQPLHLALRVEKV